MLWSYTVPNKDGRLVITHKDRLLRFGAELVFSLCEAKQVEVVILNQGEDATFEEDLANSIIAEIHQEIPLDWTRDSSSKTNKSSSSKVNKWRWYTEKRY